MKYLQRNGPLILYELKAKLFAWRKALGILSTLKHQKHYTYFNLYQNLAPHI